jgi:threonine synthase
MIRRQDRTVVISTANGLKFPEFKIKYHEGTLPDVEDRYANRPLVLPPDYEQVKQAALGAAPAKL